MQAKLSGVDRRAQDEIGADDEIGRAVVRLADLRVNDVADMWVPVKPLMEHEGVSRY